MLPVHVITWQANLRSGAAGELCLGNMKKLKGLAVYLKH